MIKLIIVLSVLFVIVIIFRELDWSKEAMVRRRQKATAAKDKFDKSIYTPFCDFVEKKAGEKRVSKKKRKLEKAGFKMSYASNLLLCVASGLLFGIVVFVVSRNIYLSIVCFAGGWTIPSLIINFTINKRIQKLDEQLGTLMRMTTKRYQIYENYWAAFKDTIPDFVGVEPITAELKKTVEEVDILGYPVTEALYNLADRTGNRYMYRYAKYYDKTQQVGTKEAQEMILAEAVKQYEEHISNTKELRRQLSATSTEAYIMLAVVPAIVIFSATQSQDYIPFMTQTTMGQVGSALIIAGWLICFWFVNTKIAAPLDKDD